MSEPRKLLEIEAQTISCLQKVDLPLLSEQCDYIENQIRGGCYSTDEEEELLAGVLDLLSYLYRSLVADNQ